MISLVLVLLQRHGLDVAPRLPSLHTAAHPWLVDALRNTKETRTRMILINYLRFALQLHAVEVGVEVLTGELVNAGSPWC